MADPTIILAFIAGLISFLSPCVLPLIPGFLAYLAGTKVGKSRLKVFMNSVMFVLGFSSIFAILGVLLNTTLQSISFQVQVWLSRIAGIIILIFAFYILGLIRIKFLEKEHKFRIKSFSISYITSFFFGAAFAVGWTPCVGAVLGAVLALTITKPGIAFFLLLSYALGLGLPFLLVGAFTAQALRLINKYQRFMKYFNLVVGILLLILGILVFTNNLTLIANWAAPIYLLTQ